MQMMARRMSRREQKRWARGVGWLVIVAAIFASLLAWPVPAQAAAPDTGPPSAPVKLVFIHHSTGGAWLADGHGGLGLALKANNYFVSDTNYGWGPDSIGSSTDIGHWWTWFRGPKAATYTEALYAEAGQHSSYSRLNSDPGGPNEVIVFKSCFPNSDLGGSATAPPPAISSNPLKGRSCGGSDFTVANAKGIYLDLLEYFAAHQEKLFVLIVSPPVRYPQIPANGRAMADWLVNEWLQSYPHKNVAVFDFYNVLTSKTGSGSSDVGLSTGNHHRVWDGVVQHKTDEGVDYLVYPSGADDHPNAAGDQKATAEFVPLLNATYNAWKNTAPAGPVITSLSPTSGPTGGGTTVVIGGSGFAGLSEPGAVTFGGVEAASYTVVSPTKVTAVTPPHAAGRVRVKVITGDGHTADTSADDFTFVAPTATPTRYEQTDSRLGFVGTWATGTSTAYSGGSFKYGNVSGMSVTVCFKGTSIAWMAKKSPAYGKARVTLDGSAVYTIDLYSAGTLYKQKVWEVSGLADGEHTVKIERTGLKRTGATAANINVDAFDITGTLLQAVVPVRYEQTDGRLLYSGAWSTFSTTSASAGAYRRANTPGASVTIPFKGTRLDWIATKGVTLGMADVSVDGGAKETVDLRRSAVAYQQKVFSTGELPYGLHTVTISWNPDNEPGRYVSVDAVDVMGSLVSSTRYQDSDTRLLYTGSWTVGAGSSYSGGGFRFANSSGSTVTIPFSGTCISLITKKSPVYGKVKVVLDDSRVFTVDLYSPTTLYRQRVWSSGGLKAGDHTLRLEWTGVKNPSSSKTNINLDAVDIVGGSLSKIPSKPGVFDASLAMSHVRELASVIGVRRGGTDAEMRAVEYAKGYLKSLGYSPQIVDVPVPNGLTSHNVVAVKPGRSPLTIVVGGHIDSKSPSPGGNDNASGSAGVLELARALKDISLVPTVVFVLFGNEEMIDSNPDHHHYGSRAFVAGMSATLQEQLVGMISLDMIGYGSTFNVRTMGQGPALLSDKLRGTASAMGISLVYLRDASTYGYSDHEPFELAGYPAAWLQWRVDPLYHTTGDTYEHVDQAKLGKAGSLVTTFLKDLTETDLDALGATRH